MAGTARIDELRKKFDENPRRYFAPLANEYRKIGDFEQAIFICQEFLPQQPGHMSGHIVYGQALFESGRHDEARSVFETALALDPENLIALRHLGDIARARGDNETARAWYRRVLESDPRNEEIAGILTSIDTDAGAAPAAPTPGSAPAPAVQEGALAIESAIGSAAPGAEAQGAAPSNPPAAEPATSAPSESSFDDVAKLFTTAAPSSGSSLSGPLQLIHEGEDLLGHPDEHTSEEAKPIRSPGGDVVRGGPPRGFSPFGGGTEDESPSGFQTPFLDGLTSAEPAATPTAPPAEEKPVPPPAAPAAADASAAFVTETMAELYVKQGHVEQALDVYRKLVKLHPNDDALAARLRQLEADRSQSLHGVPAVPTPEPQVPAAAGPTIREFLTLIADFRPRTGQPADVAPPAPPREVPRTTAPEARTTAAPQTVGGSIHNLFNEAEHPSTNHGPMAASTPQERAEPEPAPIRGRPSTPAATELSLDHVFRHATPAAGNASQSGFSFDQFFSQQAQQEVSASDTQPASDAGGGQADDIQQFNAWLEGLKKT